MSYRSALVVVVCVLGAVLPLRADVAPFPSWRVVTNGAINGAVQAGDAVYLGGSFTKIGRAIAPFDGVLDPVSLTFSQEHGCARQGGSPVGVEQFGRYLQRTGGLEDGAGPFPAVPNTVLVRVGPDCRFDRRFRAILPGIVTIRTVLDAGASVVVSLFYAASFPFTPGNSFDAVVELNGQTGALLRYWQIELDLLGVAPDGRMVASSVENGVTTIGWFDPNQGRFLPAGTVPNSTISIEVLGPMVVLSQGVSDGWGYAALDATTLAPLPSWPLVHAYAGAQTFAAGGGRVFIAGQDLTVDGVAAPRILAFDAVTGTRVQSWAAPAWIDDSRSMFTRLYVAAGRLLVIGDFAPGAPRDTIAALDATTGALDPWELPFAGPLPMMVDSRLHFGAVTSTNRVARDRLAAVAAATGALLPWTAATPSPVANASVSALAADAGAGYLYAGGVGAVRRYGLLSGALDPSWQLDLAARTDTPEAVSAIAIDQGKVFVTGSFYRARDGVASSWQDREGGAAMTVGGTLTPWRPRIEARCIIDFGSIGTIHYPPIIFPCISQIQISEGRVFLQGTLQRLEAPGEPPRSLIAVTADAGALDPILPFVPWGAVTAITAGPTALFAAAVTALGFDGQRYLARVDAGTGARLIATLGSVLLGPRPSAMASRDARLYADLERDEGTGLPTGNPVLWRRPVAVTGGVLDIEPATAAGLAWYSATAPVPPAAPTGVTADLNGARVTLRWSPGSGDLRRLVAPPPPSGTAAISYVVTASVAPGGPHVAQLDTGSPDTEYAVVAPPGTYFVRVQARNATGTSLPSEEVRVDVLPAAPEPPIATIADAHAGDVNVQWQAPPHGWTATGYLLEAGSSYGATDVGVVPVSGLEFHAAGVPPGRYYVRVRAVNANGVSPPGEEVAVDVR